MDDLVGKIIILSNETIEKLAYVKKKFNLRGEITDTIIKAVANLLLEFKKEILNETIRDTAQRILEEVEEYWEAEPRAPPKSQIQANIESHHNTSAFVFEEALRYLINAEKIEIDITDIGVERITKPLRSNFTNKWVT